MVVFRRKIKEKHPKNSVRKKERKREVSLKKMIN